MNDTWQALADSTRRKILELLSERAMSAGEIASHFQISKPSISHHLNILKNAELVNIERQGQSIIYEINTTVFQDLVRVFAKLSKKKSNHSIKSRKHKNGKD